MRTYCISHVKDVDGIGAAAIVKAATGADVHLSDYSLLIDDLHDVPEGIKEFVLCDLGGDNANVDSFVGTLGKIASRAKVTYIDHHFMSPDAAKKLKRAGVRMVHDEDECSSMLAYFAFKDSLPERSRLIALMGAVTDYMDGSPKASRLMEQADRQFVLLESTMLAYAIAKHGDQKGYADFIVEELSKMKHPHEIEGVPESAVAQLGEMVRLGEEVKKKGTRMGDLAYMVTDQHSTGNIAKLLIGAFEVPVGVALKEQQKGWYEVSLRRTSECKVHLGRTIGKIASELGGNGGGHAKAAGARIPKANMQKMLDELLRIV
jgi:RecJ-like exonuclease